MPYPGALDNLPTDMQGTTNLADSTDDHALNHRSMGSAVNNLETKLGLSAGSPTLNKILSGSGNGTSVWSQTWNNGTLGTAQLIGGTLGTAMVIGGTINNAVIGTPAITGGTASSQVLGTPSVDFISARNAGTGIGFNQSIYPSEGTLTDSAGGTLTADARASQIYYCVLGTTAGNRTVGTPTNASPYQQLTYAFKASGSANGTLVWSGIFRFSQDSGTPAIGTGTSWNYYGWRYNVIDTKWDFMGQSKNII